MAGRERLIEKRVHFLEAMEAACQLRTGVERARAARRHPDCLSGDEFGPVMVCDTTEDVTPQEQQLRECEQGVAGRTFGAPQLQAVDRCRKIGDGTSAARAA